jgi:hypothetical protein
LSASWLGAAPGQQQQRGQQQAAGHAPAASHEDVSIVIGAGNMDHEQVISVRAPTGAMGGVLPRMRA